MIGLQKAREMDVGEENWPDAVLEPNLARQVSEPAAMEWQRGL